MKLLAVAVCLAAGALLAASPAEAKVCKDPIVAKSSSGGRFSEAEREARARRGALMLWRAKARKQHNWAYRFWSRAEDRMLNCAPGKSEVLCTARARPCRLL
jgi:hypothetical protein